MTTVDVRPYETTTGIPDTYDEWRRRFMADRLRILYLLGLLANPAAVLLDVLLFREHRLPLLLIQAVLQLGLLAGLLALMKPVRRCSPHALLVFWVVFANICITHITLELGGFDSQYYSGLKLVFLSAAVIVPVSWPSHLLGQVASLSYYYGANLIRPMTETGAEVAVGTAFFFVWMCLALLCSVFLYERLQRAEFQARVAERRVRAELQAANQNLRELDSRKSEFVSIVSHELRAPMTAIQGFVENMLIGIGGGSLTDKQRYYLSRVQFNVTRLRRMINDLLDLSRIEAGRMEVRIEPVAVTAFIENIVDSFQTMAREKSVTLLARLSVPTLMVLADSDKLTQILTNLIHNALKFTPPGGEIRVEVERQDDGFVQFCVADTGCGIPAGDVAKVFDKFYRSPGVSSEEVGAGLGLAIVKNLVELHRGRIWVQSEPGQGSRLFFTMPLAPDDSTRS